MRGKEPDALQKVLVLMKVLATQTGRDLSSEVVDLYLESLEDLGWPQVSFALRTIVLDAKTFPTIGDIRRACGEMKATAAELAECVPHEIWRAVERYGLPNAKYALPSLSPLARECVASLGGWDAVVMSADSYEAMNTLKAQWRGLAKIEAKRLMYTQLSSTRDEERPNRLVGGRAS